MTEPTLFSDFLSQLGVPHTKEYSDSQFAAMSFQSMFGLSKLLQQYGIDTQGIKVNDKTELQGITPPFLADTEDGFIIVTGYDGDNVQYLSFGEKESINKDEFIKAWNGIALLAFPNENSIEPDYKKHRLYDLIDGAKRWALYGIGAFIFIYLFIANKIYADWSKIALAVFDICGLALTFMLIQKTLKIKTRAGDAVCGVLQAGGCDSILELKASSFFGIFKWSEVGFAYFSVSLLALMVFPQSVGYLALCNACCLPFTVWSIWYQKFRAKVWCTLCVSVQTTLWLLFFCYLFGGWYHHIFPLGIGFIVLVACYGGVLLAMNALDSSTLKLKSDEEDTKA